MSDKDSQLPDAEHSDEQPDDYQEMQIVLGPPFAIAHDCGLVEAGAEVKTQNGRATSPGAYCTISCDDCGTVFRANLLSGEHKQCPGCSAEYTTALLVARSDDDEILIAALETVFIQAGYDAEGELAGGQADDSDEQPDDYQRAEVVESGGWPPKK